METLSLKSLVLPNVNMKELFEVETHSTQPTLFIITPGADPSDDIKQNALAIVGEDKFVQVPQT